MKNFGGKVLFLDRNDINTDEIIPAKYLTEITKEALKPYLLEDLKLPGFDPKKDIAAKSVVLTRGNFGCGSSREHAPWALEQNGINMVIGESFARIFRQNMYNCGMLAVELPADTLVCLFSQFIGKDTSVSVDLKNSSLSFKAEGADAKAGEKTLPFKLEGFDRALIEAGGWLEYAEEKY
jgi:3-isopropylmalate/(R)-2-methylmalate dehydratase small subunit